MFISDSLLGERVKIHCIILQVEKLLTTCHLLSHSWLLVDAGLYVYLATTLKSERGLLVKYGTVHASIGCFVGQTFIYDCILVWTLREAEMIYSGIAYIKGAPGVMYGT